MRAAAEADLESRSPFVEREGSRDRDGEAPIGGQLGELGQRVDALGSILVEAVTHPEPLGGGEVGDGEHPFRIAPGDPNEIGQRAADRRGVEDEVDRTVPEGPHPLDHAIPIGGDGGPKITQPPSEGLAGGGDHPHAAQQGDLHGGVPDGAPGAVDQDRLPGIEPEPREMCVRGVDRHRQRSCLREVEAAGHGHPAVHDRAVGGAGRGAAGPVSCSKHQLAETDAVWRRRR